MTLADRVVVITGATGGAGRVVARRFAAEGARLALFSTNPTHLAALTAELPTEQVWTHAVDLRDAAATRAAAQATLTRWGRADILLHLVGGWAGGTPVTEVAADTVTDLLQQHLWTTLNLMQAFVPHLVSNGWGRVIAVSSPFARDPQARGAPYAIGKAAQEALFLTLAQEIQDTGVTANLLLVRSIDAQHERDRARTRQNAAWTTTEEIAAALLYVCSDEARAVNGARLPLYGRP
jgi:NAD(P)-dependent dehydrogenase (short-subunit alcohol dehydrogenase family)